MTQPIQGSACPYCGFVLLNESVLPRHVLICPKYPANMQAVAPVSTPVVQPTAVATVPTPVQKPAMPQGMETPALDHAFKVSDEHMTFFNILQQKRVKGDITNVRIVGPSGLGKSSMAYYFAGLYSCPFLDWQCHLITEVDEWWGVRELDVATGTHMDESLLVQAIETPGAVILLDEVNRAHPIVLNGLLGLLDHRRRQWVPTLKRYVTVAEGVTFFLSMNQGAEYNAVNELDKAFSDRAPITLRVTYPAPEVERAILMDREGISEDKANHLVRFANILRGNDRIEVDVSTRVLMAAASLISSGMPLRDAVTFACINSVQEESDRTTCLQALQQSEPAQTVDLGTPV